MTYQVQELAVRLRQEAAADHLRLFLVRHGTTTMNVENRYPGGVMCPLDARDIKTRSDAARHFPRPDDRRLHRAAASDRSLPDRSSRMKPGSLTCASDGLNNIDYGVWEGMTAAEAEGTIRTYALCTHSPGRAACPMGERFNRRASRMIAALQLIGRRHPGESVRGSLGCGDDPLAVAATGIEDQSWRIPVGAGP